MKRIIAYDKNVDKMISPNRIEKTVDNFDLINDRLKVNEMSLENFEDELKHIVDKHKPNAKKTLSEKGFPADLMR